MNESNELIARIESLEKKNRRLMMMGGAALVAVAGLGVMSMRPACNSVSAERFVLLDSSGHQRALLTAYETGGLPQFALYDKKGRAVATLGVEQTGAFLSLADGNADKSVRYGVGCNATGGDASNRGAPEKSACDSKKNETTMAQDDLR
jgi:hypothetical protein